MIVEQSNFLITCSNSFSHLSLVTNVGSGKNTLGSGPDPDPHFWPGSGPDPDPDPDPGTSLYITSAIV